MQQWAISFGKEIAAMSARYSGAKLLQKVRAHTPCIKHTHTHTPLQRPIHQLRQPDEKYMTSLRQPCRVSLVCPSPQLWRPIRTELLLSNICTWPRDQWHDTLNLNTHIYADPVCQSVLLICFKINIWSFYSFWKYGNQLSVCVHVHEHVDLHI